MKRCLYCRGQYGALSAAERPDELHEFCRYSWRKQARQNTLPPVPRKYAAGVGG